MLKVHNASKGEGIQQWKVPESGLYRIEAWGAAGGDRWNTPGGPGAKLQGDFFLAEGQWLHVLVGQQGGWAENSGGGGGGTFVAVGGTWEHADHSWSQLAPALISAFTTSVCPFSAATHKGPVKCFFTPKSISKWSVSARLNASSHRWDDGRSQRRPIRAVARSARVHEQKREGETSEIERKRRHRP